MLLKPAFCKAGTPYPKVTGLFCRIPLDQLSCYALAFSARAPFLVLGTVIKNSSDFSFYELGALTELLSFPSFHLFHSITLLQRFLLVKYSDKSTQPSLKRQKICFLYRNRILIAQECEPVSLSHFTN